MENQNEVWITGTTIHEQTKSRRHEFEDIAPPISSFLIPPTFYTNCILSHCSSSALSPLSPLLPPPPNTFPGISYFCSFFCSFSFFLGFWFDFFFSVYLICKDVSIHPPPKSSSRARDSRAAFLPHLLLLCGQGQRGCCWTTFWKKKIWKLLLPSPLPLSLSLLFSHDCYHSSSPSL